MTDTARTCRDGVRAYRNLQDWCKYERDAAIKQANERANPVEAEAPTSDAGASPAPSFVTAVSETEAYTKSQESCTSLNEDSNIPGGLEESGSSIEDLVEYTLPAKRSSKRSKHPQTRRKRRNAGKSSGRGHGHGSAVTSVSDLPSVSKATVEQSLRWSWTNGKFQCYKGQDLVKEQNDTPADVWIYCDQGWPGQEGKKWRLWISVTREILYS